MKRSASEVCKMQKTADAEEEEEAPCIDPFLDEESDDEDVNPLMVTCSTISPLELSAEPEDKRRDFEIEFNVQATTFRDSRRVPDWTIPDDLVPLFLREKERFGPDFTVEERCEIAIFSTTRKLQLRSSTKNDYWRGENIGKRVWSWNAHSSLYGITEGKEFSKEGKFLHFHTLQSEEEFSLEQLEFLAKTIQKILEDELGFAILSPRIYFHV